MKLLDRHGDPLGLVGHAAAKGLIKVVGHQGPLVRFQIEVEVVAGLVPEPVPRASQVIVCHVDQRVRRVHELRNVVGCGQLVHETNQRLHRVHRLVADAFVFVHVNVLAVARGPLIHVHKVGFLDLTQGVALVGRARISIRRVASVQNVVNKVRRCIVNHQK